MPYLAPAEPQIPILDIDNQAVRQTQIQRLEQLRRARNANCRSRLARVDLERSAATGEGNLLECAVDAARKRVTLGEISLALENVWGRYEASSCAATGVYSAESAGTEEFKTARRMAEEFEQSEGRRPRILIAKMGQDGHDRGAKVIATGFADIGFDVDIGPLFQTPREVARFAIESDVHAVGVSSLAAAHKTLVPQLIDELRNQDRGEILVIVGGVIPPQDYAFLRQAGVAAIFGPGTVVSVAAQQTLGLLCANTGGRANLIGRCEPIRASPRRRIRRSSSLRTSGGDGDRSTRSDVCARHFRPVIAKSSPAPSPLSRVPARAIANWPS